MIIGACIKLATRSLMLLFMEVVRFGCFRFRANQSRHRRCSFQAEGVGACFVFTYFTKTWHNLTCIQTNTNLHSINNYPNLY